MQTCEHDCPVCGGDVVPFLAATWKTPQLICFQCFTELGEAPRPQWGLVIMISRRPEAKAARKGRERERTIRFC